MIKEGGKSRFSNANEDNDPMATLVNLVDIMLVLAVGFLILAISSTGITEISHNPQDQNSENPMQDAINFTQGKEVPNNIEQGSQSGSGYNKVGSVYKDPETQQLIMVEG
jgi:hypothetical protein